MQKRKPAPAPVVASDWLSRKQAAVYLGVSVKALENYSRTGTGPAYHKSPSGLVRYHRTLSLDAWLGTPVSSTTEARSRRARQDAA